MSETRFYPVVTNNTDSIEKLDGQIIFDIDHKSISIDIDNSRFAVQSVDSELSEISKNPVQNKVIAEKLYDIEEKISKIEVPEIPELPSDLVRGNGKLFTLTSEEAIQEHLTYDDLGALISYIGEDVYDEMVPQSAEPELKYEKNSLYLVVETTVENDAENGVDSKEISAKKIGGNENKAPVIDDVFITKTEDEVNALLVEENIGKLVSYVGETDNTLVGAPFAVGDKLTTIYFNTAVKPNFDAIKASSTIIRGADIHQDYASSYFALALNTVEGGAYLGFTDMGAMQEGLWAIMLFGGEGIIYLSQDVPAEITGGEPFTAGWQMDRIDMQDTFGGEVSVTQMGGQEVWGAYISRAPFVRRSPYDKNTLYMVAEEEKEAPEIEAGDVIDKLYFDTSLSDEEMLTNLSALTYDGDGIAVLIHGCDNDDALYEVCWYDMSAITEGASNAYCMLATIQSDILIPIYSTEEVSDEVFGVPVSKGWNTNEVAYGGPAQEVNQQDLWKSYISKEPFSSAVSIVAKPIVDPSFGKSELPKVSAADAGKVLSVTTNGTWATAAPETAFKQINISLSDTSFVTRDIDPNVFYVFDQPLQVSLTINLNEGKPGVMHEYMFQFSVGYNLTLNLPGNVRWINQEPPTFTTGHTYQVSILNNLAVCGEF